MKKIRMLAKVGFAEEGREVYAPEARADFLIREHLAEEVRETPAKLKKKITTLED